MLQKVLQNPVGNTGTHLNSTRNAIWKKLGGEAEGIRNSTDK